MPGASSEHLGTMMGPLTTSSDAAKQHFMIGLRLADAERAEQAHDHFLEAVGADGSFALAHLYTAYYARTAPEYKTHLEHGIALADKASRAERLQIQVEQRLFAADPNGALDLAQQLVTATPGNPRSLQTLAGIQFQLNRPADARATLERAMKAAPGYAPVYWQLGNSYLVTEPTNPSKGLAIIRRAAEMLPNEPNAHDYMGDAYRANNEFVKARAEYTKMIELDPANAGAYLQRGHVNSFIGNFSEARADYDKSISIGTAANKASYPLFHAYVNLYAGDPAAAERELEAMVAAVDGMDIPNKLGVKVSALNPELLIATHYRHLDVAQRAADQLKALWQQQADAVGTPEYRIGRQADMIWADGLIAVTKGDYEGARAKAREFMKAVEPIKDPRKNERAHVLLGRADLAEKKYASAAAHFAEGNQNDAYTIYLRALALDGAGKKAEARKLFKRVAETNFNNVGVALARKDAMRRAKS
jgi:tetratricopeptide (TPR) repeat protein